LTCVTLQEVSQLTHITAQANGNVCHMTLLRYLKSPLLILAVCISSCALSGCVESTFHLASDSNLPRSVAIPPGLKRSDVAVTLNLYAPLSGPNAKFVLTDRKGRTLAEVKGKTKELSHSMYCQVFTESGVSEIIELKPYREHEGMEQNGRAVALFYVVDDPTVVKALLGRMQLE
jgi:hypothetical protein